MPKCEHDEQEQLTLRFETEKYRKQSDGSMKADQEFVDESVTIASKCLKCGEIVSRASDKEIQAAVEKFVGKFFQ